MSAAESTSVRETVARFALRGATLPAVTDTLPLAELARRALMGLAGRHAPAGDGAPGRSATLAGKDEGGTPLHGHGHAFYLPADEDGDGRLDHLTVVASAGFGPAERRAVESLRVLQGRGPGGGGSAIEVALLGLGAPGQWPAGPVAAARRWASATPFLATRYPKRNGARRDPPHLLTDPPAFAEAVLREELARWLPLWDGVADIAPAEVVIEPLVDDAGVFRIGAGRWRPGQFVRARAKPGDDGGRRIAGAFRLTFPRPVPGPIVLGHSAHFGMGLFLPA